MIGSVAVPVCGLLLGVFGMAGLVHVARSGPPGARGLGLGLGAGLVAALGVDFWLWQLGVLEAAGRGLLAIPVAGLALGLLAGLAAQRPLVHRPPRHPRVPGYELVSVLGTGAGTVVYLARHLDPDRFVRLKRLRPGSPSPHSAIEARVGHPNIAPVYTSFEHAGRTYLTGEYVDGASLRRVVEQAGPLRPEQAMEAVCDALEGLAYAHARGLSHGGLNPENVIVDHHGLSRLVDFGQRGPASPTDDVAAAADLLEELLEGRPPAAVATVMRQARADRPDAVTPSAEEFLQALEQAAAACYGPDWRSRGSLAYPVLVTLSAEATGAAGPVTGRVAAKVLVAEAIAGLAIMFLAAVPPALVYRQGLMLRLWSSSPASSAAGSRSSPLPFFTSIPPPPGPSPAPAGPSADPGAPQPSPAVPVTSRPTRSGTSVPISPPPAPPPSATPSPPTPIPTPTPTPTPSPTPTSTPTPTSSPTPTPTPTAT